MSCGQQIRALDNIPLVSYFMLRGRWRRVDAERASREPQRRRDDDYGKHSAHDSPLDDPAPAVPNRRRL